MKRQEIPCETCASRKFSMFECCRSAELSSLTDNKSTNTYKKGQVLFFEGNKPLGLFCINQGMLKIYKTGSDGKEQILRFAQAGDFAGYHSVIAGENYHATAEALEDTTACFIPKEVFLDMLDHNPALTKVLMRSLASELGNATERLTNMAQKTVRERVAETLLLMYDAVRRPAGIAEDQIAVKLPREDIANVAGTSTETAIRFLSEFKDEGMIDLQGKQIFIRNRKALMRTARVAS